MAVSLTVSASKNGMTLKTVLSVAQDH